MSREMIQNETKPSAAQPGWNWLYRLGGIAALTAVCAYLLDTCLSFTSPGMEPGVRTAVEWFGFLQANPFLELRNLGVLNILAMLFGIPIYAALVAAHRRVNPAGAALAAILFFAGAVIYIANNPAIPLAVLSSKYAAANAAQQPVLAAAGEALLAQGEDFTPGFFVGFICSEMAGLFVSVIMLRGRVFGQANAALGLLAFTLLIVFTIWATFIPVYFEIAMLVAMIGGLAGLAWYILTARKLFQLSRADVAARFGRAEIRSQAVQEGA